MHKISSHLLSMVSQQVLQQTINRFRCPNIRPTLCCIDCMLYAQHSSIPGCSCAQVVHSFLVSQARAYRAIYDAVKTPRSDVDYSLSPPPRSSVRPTTCARTQVNFSCVSADGRWNVYRVILCMFCICNQIHMIVC